MTGLFETHQTSFQIHSADDHLMTFGQIAEVSPGAHLLQDAYAVLSQKHDASKGAFKRQRNRLSSEQFADYLRSSAPAPIRTRNTK